MRDNPCSVSRRAKDASCTLPGRLGGRQASDGLVFDADQLSWGLPRCSFAGLQVRTEQVVDLEASWGFLELNLPLYHVFNMEASVIAVSFCGLGPAGVDIQDPADRSLSALRDVKPPWACCVGFSWSSRVGGFCFVVFWCCLC